MHAHCVCGCHDLDHVLEDQEAKQRRKIQLSKEGGQDATIDLKVRLRDLCSCMFNSFKEKLTSQPTSPSLTKRRKVHGFEFQSMLGNQLRRTLMNKRNRYICGGWHTIRIV